MNQFFETFLELSKNKAATAEQLARDRAREASFIEEERQRSRQIVEQNRSEIGAHEIALLKRQQFIANLIREGLREVPRQLVERGVDAHLSLCFCKDKKLSSSLLGWVFPSFKIEQADFWVLEDNSFKWFKTGYSSGENYTYTASQGYTNRLLLLSTEGQIVTYNQPRGEIIPQILETRHTSIANTSLADNETLVPIRSIDLDLPAEHNPRVAHFIDRASDIAVGNRNTENFTYNQEI